MAKNLKDYTAESIEILDGLSHVRARPGMYIGDTGSRGLHHLIWEIFDNSVDEYIGGFCDCINLELNTDGSITIEDNGRGIPVDLHPVAKQPAVRVVMTTLNAGGKFGGGSYSKSGGLHGVGASVVNALSSYMNVECYIKGKVYREEYKDGGKPVTQLQKDGSLAPIGKTLKRGTKTTFKPDPAIFSVGFRPELIKTTLREKSYINKKLRIKYVNHIIGEEIEFYQENGIADYIDVLTKEESPITPSIYLSGTYNDIDVEVAFRYVKDYGEKNYSFCNAVPMHGGGTHITGIRTALTRLMNQYAKSLNLIKKEATIDGRDIRSGLVAIVSVRHPDPQFEGQTKDKLGNGDAEVATREIFLKEATLFFDRNIEIVESILENAVAAMKIRMQTDKLKTVVLSKETQLANNGKLASCISKDNKETELFIVEGDSAGGTAKTGRNRKFQAVLPLRGKVLNVEKASMDRVLDNKEIASLIISIGCNYGEELDLAKLKYDKIIITTDADVDGHHIRSLLLTFFYRFMPELITEGHVYKAIPPLYKISFTNGKKTDFVYAYSDEELEEKKQKIKNKITGVQRYKGLGEMSAQQLWDTTLNPETRTLAKITIEDAIRASQTTELYMGPKVEPRKDVIMNKAYDTKRNLDY